MNSLSIQKNIPVTDAYDVVVCGGGPSGFIAAISAARSGKRTALIERYGFLGGTATAGYVVPISGFFFKGTRVVGGIAWEFVKRLEALGAALVELPRGHVSVNIEYYKLIAEEMVLESGVTLYTNAFLSDAVCDADGRITHAVIESKSGTEAIAGSIFIDATGDGDLAARTGVPMLPERELQPVSLCFVLTNVDTETPLLRDCIHHDGKNGRASCNKEIRSFLLSCTEEDPTLVFGGPWFNVLLKGESLAVNITRRSVDATDRAAYTRAEQQLRRDMFRIVGLLREKYPEFKHAEIVSSGINAGVRETRHIRGLRTMTLDDVLSGEVPTCPVAHCAHPMDIHASKGAGQKLTSLTENCYVPFEATVSAACGNLLTAGRSLSAEREPYASLRVQATLMSVGESVGVAAALALDMGLPVYALPLPLLNERISARGCVL